MKEFYDVKLISRYKITKVGGVLLIISILGFISLLFLGDSSLTLTDGQIWWSLLSCILTFVIGILLWSYRGKKNAQIQFHPEGIILKTEAGFIPLKYHHIKKLPISDYTHPPNKTDFYIITTDDRRYEVNADSVMYEALIERFPEKDKSL